jgi:hypothetical protein
VATYNEQLQTIWHKYEQQNGQQPATTREAVEWGIAQGLLKPPKIDPFSKLAEDMATALRAEYKVDKFGRKYRVNHAVRVSSAGVQLTIWSEMEHATRPHMQKAYAQRRKGVADDLFQLKTDVDVYNDMHPQQEPINLVLDFTDDVAERQGLGMDDVA